MDNKELEQMMTEETDWQEIDEISEMLDRSNLDEISSKVDKERGTRSLYYRLLFL